MIKIINSRDKDELQQLELDLLKLLYHVDPDNELELVELDNLTDRYELKSMIEKKEHKVEYNVTKLAYIWLLALKINMF